MTPTTPTTPTTAEVLASYRSGAYTKYTTTHCCADCGEEVNAGCEQHPDAEVLSIASVLDWAGTPVGAGSRVEWYDADGQLARGVVREVTDRPGALWDGSTDAALTIDRAPNHVAICSARSVRTVRS